MESIFYRIIVWTVHSLSLVRVSSPLYIRQHNSLSILFAYIEKCLLSYPYLVHFSDFDLALAPFCLSRPMLSFHTPIFPTALQLLGVSSYSSFYTCTLSGEFSFSIPTRTVSIGGLNKCVFTSAIPGLVQFFL